MLHRWGRAARRAWQRLLDSLSPPASLGRRGELLARRYLQRQGCVILEQGFQGPDGEIDLIAALGRTILFVEVKTRRSRRHGDPSEAVDRRKQRRIIRTAMTYLSQRRLHPHCGARFDIISIVWPEGQSPELRHLPGAFEYRE